VEDNGCYTVFKMKNLTILIMLAIGALLYQCAKENLPPPPEENFMSEQIKILKETENYEQQYLDATRARQQRMDEQVERDGG
jgi:hypothetical protein